MLYGEPRTGKLAVYGLYACYMVNQELVNLQCMGYMCYMVNQELVNLRCVWVICVFYGEPTTTTRL